MQVCCSMTSDYETCGTFIAFVFSTICSVPKKSPFESQGKQCDFRPRSILWCITHRPLLHHPTPPCPLKLAELKAEGAQSALIYRATLMCGLTADISNVQRIWHRGQINLCSTGCLFLFSQ